jgi:hypothetical protein
VQLRLLCEARQDCAIACLSRGLMTSHAYVCCTCGTQVRQLLSWVGKQQNSIEAKGGAVVQFSHTEEEPQCCPICEDERQYVAKGGQRC